MKYKPTPFNVISALLVIYGLYLIVESNGAEGWGFLFGAAFIAIALVFLATDFFVQKLRLGYKKLFVVESVVAAITAFLIYKSSGTKHLILPPDYLGEVVVVYGVPNFPELPTRYISNKLEVEVPESGIVITSSKLPSSYPNVSLGSGSNHDEQKEAVPNPVDTLNLRNTVYQFESWTVRKRADWSVGDIDPIKKAQIREVIEKSSTANTTQALDSATPHP